MIVASISLKFWLQAQNLILFQVILKKSLKAAQNLILFQVILKKSLKAQWSSEQGQVGQ